MAYIGNTVQTQGFAPAIDYFNGNGVTVTFTLSRPIASVAQVIVAIDNVIQNPSSAFNVAGNSITFTSAPLSGTNNIWVEYTSLITTYQGISQDPTVIGDIRATGGYLAEGDFGNSFVDGAILDYVTGAGRVTVGELDDLVFYHGGTAGRSEMMKVSYAGNSYIVGNLGIGTTSPTFAAGGGLQVKNSGFTSVRVSGGSSTGVDFAQATDGLAYMYNRDNNGLVFGTNNTERMRIASNGYVNIGAAANTTNKVNVLLSGTAISGNTTGSAVGAGNIFQLCSNNWGATNSTTFLLGGGDSSTVGQICAGIGFSRESDANWGTQLRFYTHQSATDVLDSLNERMRITSGGDLLVGKTTTSFSTQGANIQNDGALLIAKTHNDSGGAQLYLNRLNVNGPAAYFYKDTNNVGNISVTASATAYNTSSDYRLKENIAPMTGALATVAQLKPVTYKWKSDGSDGQGFIAHELQSVVPDAVSGEKDAMETYTDEDGKEQTRIKPQGVDTSFLVATLTAAIQEQQAMIEELKTKVAALEAK